MGKKCPQSDPVCAGRTAKTDQYIKLNTNENPYPPSPKVFDEHGKVNVSGFSLYPDPSASVLVEALAKYHGIGADQVFTGVGSDDVLALAFLTFLIRIRQSFSRISPIRFIRSGRKYTAFRMNARHCRKILQ